MVLPLTLLVKLRPTVGFLGLAVLQAADTSGEAARAILEKNCFACHGSAQMSGLDLRQRETILRGGKRGPAIVPGKPEESLLYQASTHLGELKMPPSKNPMSPGDLTLLRKWI